MLSAVFSRLSLGAAPILSNHSRSIFTKSCPELFRATPCLMAEPLKKKKKIDPAVVRAREERRKKKLEKQIRKLQRNSRQLKPIDECEIPLHVYDTRNQRVRRAEAATHEEMESQALLFKEWARYRGQDRIKDIQIIDMVMTSQLKALEELKLESEELYQAAIQMDPNLVPFTITGPVHTPPIAGYDAPDGDYVDVSKNWHEMPKFG